MKTAVAPASLIPSRPPASRIGWACLFAGCAAAFVIAGGIATPAWLEAAAFVAHAPLWLLGAFLLTRDPEPRSAAKPGRIALSLALVAVLSGAALLLGWLPSAARGNVVTAHVWLGVCVGAFAVWRALRMAREVAFTRWAMAAVAMIVIAAPVVAGATREWRESRWTPPTYDPEAWRFLTASVAAQADSPAFPSALKGSTSRASCQTSGCHSQPQPCPTGSLHSRAAASSAYRATLADFEGRRGAEGARWCGGCHSGQAVTEAAVPMPGIGCVTCHTANVHGLYGSAALTLKPGMSEAARSYALWRPERHRQAMRPALLRSAEFCGACHRKSYSLPQNGFRWMPVQDEYGQWQDSNYSGQAMLAPTTTGGRKDCRGCHLDPGLKKRPALEIEAFLRPVRPDGPAPVALTDAAARSMAGADEPHYLDIVVRNSGIGHEFPTGMPDQREAWLEVRLTGPAGTAVLEAGRVRPGAPLPASAHAYRLIGTDRGGRPVNHGNLDELTNIVEHRRIPAGGADLARYAFGASRPRLGALSVRLLRRRRPEFAGWVRRATGCDDEGSECIEVLAERRWPLGSGARTKQPGDGVDAAAARWRAYGEALASVKAYPFAIQALRRSLSARPRDVAGLLALGRVFLAEGDLLAGQDQLRLARDAAGRQDPRVQAWEAVATRTAHPERAAETLAELVEQHPRDRRLRFELGRAQMDLLRNREALEQFRTMLDLDPTDAGAHYNLMLSHQRLNELSEARKEEVIYRLLASEERISPRAARGREAVEATLLHVHELEPPR